MRPRIAIIVASIVLTHGAAAQQTAARRPDLVTHAVDFVVKTVPLHHLTSQEAMKLLLPYVRTLGGGVYEVSPSIRAVTIRETPAIYTEMIAVLGQYDREPATIALNFQLIAAENTTTRDPAVAGLDSLLRGVLKFSGYRLLSASVASASELGHVSQSLSADGESFPLSVDVSDVRVDGTNASVHLNVTLWRGSTRPILSTGVTVPMGQTVVLGTTTVEGGQRALILTVRPQLAKK